jgi:hypothetical protein
VDDELRSNVTIVLKETKGKESDGMAYLLNDGILYTKTRTLVHKQQFKQLFLFSEISNISKTERKKNESLFYLLNCLIVDVLLYLANTLIVSMKQGQSIEFKFMSSQDRNNFYISAIEEKKKVKDTIK